VASRVGLAGILVVAFGLFAGSAPSQPSAGTALYTVRVDPRLCPSPRCGGYWVGLTNGARTRCSDGIVRGRCYVARAVDEDRHLLATGVPDEALVRGSLDAFAFEGGGTLGVLVVTTVYAPAGTAPTSGGYYRIVDTGIRCIRAPCFSLRAAQVNGSTRTPLSGIDLNAAGATTGEVARAQAALRSKNGLLARGRFTRSADGGRVFTATRLFLRVPRTRA
jgi:hypothetical protein